MLKMRLNTKDIQINKTKLTINFARQEKKMSGVTTYRHITR